MGIIFTADLLKTSLLFESTPGGEYNAVGMGETEQHRDEAEWANRKVKSVKSKVLSKKPTTGSLHLEI